MKHHSTHRNAKPSELLNALSQATSVLITGHVRPDGDSLGCMIALAHLLNRAGIKAVATAERSGLGGPGFLTGVEKLLAPDRVAKGRFDLLVSLDCGSLERLPEPVQPLVGKLPLINIDHHRTNTQFGTLNWIDGHVSSTGEMLWKLARKAGWALDGVSAEALWVAVITDSGRFAYDQTTPATLRCGADLLRYGVRTAYINDVLYCSFSRISIELKKRAYRTLTVSGDDNAVASVTLTGKDFEETGGTKADAEDVIEIPRSLVGNRVALFFYGSDDDGETRVSIRTRAPLDATVLAKAFGGGGHARAAGCTLKEPLSQAKKTVGQAVVALLKQHPHT